MNAAKHECGHTPITMETRWFDVAGREWRVVANIYFGRYMCVLVDRPSRSGVWTAKEIRTAIASATGAGHE